jgi:hypothetical protein
MASAPPKNAKTVSGILRNDNVVSARPAPTTIIAQLRSVLAWASAMWPRAITNFCKRLARRLAIA